MNLGEFSIRTRMVVLVLFVMSALLVIMGYIYYKLDGMQQLYDRSCEFSSRQDMLNRVIVNGLLFNSATGVVKNNPGDARAIKTVETAHAALTELSGEMQKQHPMLWARLQEVYTPFVLVGNDLLQRIHGGASGAAAEVARPEIRGAGDAQIGRRGASKL